MKTLEAQHDRIIIELIDQGDEADLGLAEQTMVQLQSVERPVFARVIAVGPGKFLEWIWTYDKSDPSAPEALRAPMSCAPGDIVSVGQYAGGNLRWQGKNYLTAKDENVIFVVREEPE